MAIDKLRTINDKSGTNVSHSRTISQELFPLQQSLYLSSCHTVSKEIDSIKYSSNENENSN